MTEAVPAGTAPSKPEASLRTRALRGSFWWAAMYPFSKGVQIVGNVILAGLLTPAAFGAVAIALVAVRALTMFSEMGINYALIQSTRDDDTFVNTAWTMQIARGVCLGAACVLLAGPIATLYGEASLAPIIRVMGLGTVLAALQSTKYVTLNRELRERPRAILELANSVVTRIAMIGIALFWPSAFALVLGTLAGTVFFTVATHFLPGRPNRLRWDREAVRTLLRFGSWVVVGAIIAYLGGQVDTLILGKLVSKHLDALGLVGVYTIAQRVARLPSEAADQLGGQLAFPVLSEVSRREPDRFRERLLEVRRAFLPAAIFLCLGVVVFSPWFFGVLYDARYAAARWMAPLITFSVWVGLLNTIANMALLSLGRTGTLALTGGIGVVTSIGGGLAGFYLGGVPGFIVGLGIGALVKHAAELVFLARAGAAIHGQDIRFSLLFLAVGGVCAACQAWAGDAESVPLRWAVGIAVPFLLFLAVAIWAGRIAWRTMKRR